LLSAARSSAPSANAALSSSSDEPGGGSGSPEPARSARSHATASDRRRRLSAARRKHKRGTDPHSKRRARGGAIIRVRAIGKRVYGIRRRRPRRRRTLENRTTHAAQAAASLRGRGGGIRITAGWFDPRGEGKEEGGGARRGRRAGVVVAGWNDRAPACALNSVVLFYLRHGRWRDLGDLARFFCFRAPFSLFCLQISPILWHILNHAPVSHLDILYSQF
jgi:hypothetical protein